MLCICKKRDAVLNKNPPNQSSRMRENNRNKSQIEIRRSARDQSAKEWFLNKAYGGATEWKQTGAILKPNKSRTTELDQRPQRNSFFGVWMIRGLDSGFQKVVCSHGPILSDRLLMPARPPWSDQPTKICIYLRSHTSHHISS